MGWRQVIDEAVAENKKLAIVIGLSAGKDSTAVALLFRKTYPQHMDKVHFLFADTGSELPETYSFLEKLQENLGYPIKHLKSRFGDLETIIRERFNGFLPGPRSRWCTRMAKVEPFRLVMDELAQTHDLVLNLVGIRADEPTRTGYVPCGQYATKVMTLMPLKDEQMSLKEVFSLVESEVGLPSYYQWRTRSGCHFCVPGDVEVLTDLGWTPFSEFAEAPRKLLAFNKDTQVLEFQTPAKVYALTGEQKLISVESRHISLKATPDHRWLVKNKRRLHGPWEFVTSKDLPTQFFAPLSGLYAGTDTKTQLNETTIRLLVAIQADGWISYNRVNFGFAKKRKIQRLQRLCAEAGEFTDLRELKKGDYEGRFSMSVSFLADQEYFDLETKTFKPSLLELPLHLRRVFLEELAYWDSQNVTHDSWTYLTANRVNAELVQTMAHLTGYTSSLFQRTNGEGHQLINCVSILKEKNYTMVVKRSGGHDWIENSAPVYCVSVPSEAFLIRSNGKILITGNCFFQRRIEWVNLSERHPDLFEHAKSFEKEKYTWVNGMTLDELVAKKDEIKARYIKRLKKAKEQNKDLSLTDSHILEQALADEDEQDMGSCSVCR